MFSQIQSKTALREKKKKKKKKKKSNRARRKKETTHTKKVKSRLETGAGPYGWASLGGAGGRGRH
jgi:hypothetical protein